MFKGFVISVAVLAATGTASAQQWQQLYQPLSAGQLPCRLMKPINFDASQNFIICVGNAI